MMCGKYYGILPMSVDSTRQDCINSYLGTYETNTIILSYPDRIVIRAVILLWMACLYNDEEFHTTSMFISYSLDN